VKSRTIEHCAAIGFERKNSLKDDLPDLTPYLSKKGGNSQGKAADNSAGKDRYFFKTFGFSEEDWNSLRLRMLMPLVDSQTSSAAPEQVLRTFGWRF
jgi:hypothetical protein